MKNLIRTSVFILAVATFVSCRHEPNRAKSNPTEVVHKEDRYLYRFEKAHSFSNPASVDTFRVEATGKDLLTSNIHFRIISSSGEVVYHEQFTGDYLIDFGISEFSATADSLTDSIRNAYIRNRLIHFFDEANFKRPAVASGAKFEDQYASRTLFEELKERSEAVSFHYLLGKEDGRYIAWSEKFGKVMLFYNCC